MAGAFGPARPWLRAPLAAGCGRNVPAHRSFSMHENPQRIFIAISAAGAFRTNDAGKTWQPINRGLQFANTFQIKPPRSDTAFIASPCIALARVLFMQKHWDVMRSDDGGDSWQEVSWQFAYRFRLSHRCACARAKYHLRRPHQERLRALSAGWQAPRLSQPHRGETSGSPSPKGLPQSDCYVNVLRDSMAVDSLDSCGIYFGTTVGQIYASADSGDNWAPIVRYFPAVLSVEVQTSAMIRVVLPAHLRTLAQVGGEVQLEITGPVTQRSILDALESAYPMLRGAAPRSHDPKTAPFREILRLRTGPVPQFTGRAIAGCSRKWNGAVSGDRCYRRRLSLRRRAGLRRRSRLSDTDVVA